MLTVFESMDLSRSKIRSIKIRFGKDIEFGKNSSAMLNITNNEIVIKRGLSVANSIVELSHEYGHEITTLGKFGIFGSKIYDVEITIIKKFRITIGRRRCNLIGEISAYNFQEQFIDKLNEMRGYGFKTKRGNLWKAMKSSPTHYIAGLLDFVPLGSSIRKEYLAKA